MKSTVFACLTAAIAATALQAGPAELAVVAAMKLPDAANYSWVTVVEDDARTYDIDGKTDRATDYSLVTMPMVANLRRRLTRGSTATDSPATVVFKGDIDCVIDTGSDWKKPEELVAANSRGSGRNYPAMAGPGGMRGGRGRRGMGGMGGSGYPAGGEDVSGSGNARGAGSPVPYSNLQKTLSRPHEEIQVIIAGYTDLKVEGGVISGNLNEIAAKLLLIHPGQNELTALKAGGTFRLWVKDGVLQKYETKLDGTLAVETNGTKREVTVHQTATTTLKDVGTTKFEVPDSARKKLNS